MVSAYTPHIDQMFADPTIGVTGTFTPDGGAVIENVRYIRRTPDDIVNLDETTFKTGNSFFDVRVSDIADPKKFDTVTINGEEFTVKSDPFHRDSERLIWTLECSVKEITP